MRGLTRHSHVVVPLVVLILGLAVQLRFPRFVDSLRLQVFDVYQQLAPRHYTPLPVRIVDVDDASLRRLGQWPWPRTRVARLVRILRRAGAAVIALDFLFSEPDRTSPENVLPLWQPTPEVLELRKHMDRLPHNDAVLASAIAGGDVVTGFALTNEATGHRPPRPYHISVDGPAPLAFVPAFKGAVTNLPELDAGAAGVGSENLIPDRDGLSRRLHLFFRVGDTFYPSFAAEVIRVAQHATSYEIAVGGGSHDPGYGRGAGIENVRIGGLVVPTDGQGRIWLHFTPPTRRRYIPAWRVFQPDFDRKSVAGQIILIGTSAVGLKDLRATPLDPATPGVALHASVIEQVLLGHFLRRPGWADAAELAYLLILALALVVLLPRLRAFGCALAGALAVALACGASWYAYRHYHWLLDPVLPSLAVLVVYSIGSLINFARTERERRQVRSAFRHYLAPAVIEQLMDDPGRLRLGGEKRETTFLFSDIAGFTTVVERMEPTQIVRVLNGYLDGACRIVLEHGGTIDKIVGDALHVMFNAPADQPDHAERAVRCALALESFCRDFVHRQAAAGVALGETRIGVNTGPVVVGNFGGSTRFDYTAHGDAINTAARLESVNRFLGTSVCVSESTRVQTHQAQYRPIGVLVLKGKTQGLMTYEPLTPERAADELAPAYENAYRLLGAGDQAAAASAFAELARLRPDDGLVAMHARRLAAGESGVVITMLEK